MHQQESLSKFTSAIVQLSRLAATLQEQFFLQKLKNLLQDIAFAQISFLHCGQGDNNVAQYIEAQRHLQVTINHALEFLTYIEYFKHSPLLHIRSAQLALLRLKFFIGDTKNTTEKIQEKNEQEVKTRQSLDTDNFPKKISTQLNGNQEKIFDFIKESHQVRAKEILDEFSPKLSGRTVKRNLRQLLKSGLILRRSENHAVFYTPAPRI